MLVKIYKGRSKEYYWILAICIINAVLYISKGAILVMVFWLALDLINQKDTKIISLKNIVIVSIALFIASRVISDDFTKYFIARFQIWFDLYENTGSFMGTRGQISDFSMAYIKENVKTWFLGVGPTNFKNINPWGYSNTHNLFLDLIMDSGFIGLSIFITMVAKGIIQSRKKCIFL